MFLCNIELLNTKLTMKRNYLSVLLSIFVFVMIHLFVSCQKNEHPSLIDFSSMSDEELLAYGRSVGAITIEEFNKEIELYFEQTNYFSNTGTEDEMQMKATAAIDHVAYGYDNYNPIADMENKKIILNDPSTGLPPGIYIAKPYMVMKSVAIPNGHLVAYLESPKCGYDPERIGASILGYKGSMSAGKWNMKSVAYMIKYNMIGQTINRFAPYQPSSFEWRYRTGTLN